MVTQLVLRPVQVMQNANHVTSYPMASQLIVIITQKFPVTKCNESGWDCAECTAKPVTLVALVTAPVPGLLSPELEYYKYSHMNPMRPGSTMLMRPTTNTFITIIPATLSLEASFYSTRHSRQVHSEHVHHSHCYAAKLIGWTSCSVSRSFQIDLKSQASSLLPLSPVVSIARFVTMKWSGL